MNQTLTMDDLAAMAESVDLECKAAQGRDGTGEVPDDFWRSYSSMANTDGGVIWLGISEKPRGRFQALGLPQLERVRKALWDSLNNRNKVSANLLTEQHIQPVSFEGLQVLRIEVPRALRQSKPVHLGSNPFGATYLRRYEGDYTADDETVRRMIAERVEDSRDDRVLQGFDVTDLDLDSVSAYRNLFAIKRPGNAWNDLPLPEFLERIGAVGKNREEGYSGLRLAGLLMFGRAEVIRDALPNYMLDYQERPEAKTERRWIDRLVPDGSWSGNVYDFFRKVYQKITVDLKVPFQLQDGQRVEDTPVHVALREALANTLIHADYTGRTSILVVKRPDMFGFRNPGLMRIPITQAVSGGNSDCRNRRLQTMFQLVGFGDHAGSGLPNIYHNWTGEHWRRPHLYELREMEQTLMELHMSSLLPADAVADLEGHLGEKFSGLSPLERLALVTASSEGVIAHGRLREISTEHPTDITKMLGKLVKEGYLVSDGVGRGMMYFLPWDKKRLAHLTDLNTEAPVLNTEAPVLNTEAPVLNTEAPPPSTHYLDWTQLGASLQVELNELATPVSLRKRVNPDVLRKTVLVLCTGRYLGRRVLARLISRQPDDLQKRILAPLVKEGLLRTAYPSSMDPRQAYIAA
jgi:ATP-dependent DNA helicase RecG